MVGTTDIHTLGRYPTGTSFARDQHSEVNFTQNTPKFFKWKTCKWSFVLNHSCTLKPPLRGKQSLRQSWGVGGRNTFHFLGLELRTFCRKRGGGNPASRFLTMKPLCELGRVREGYGESSCVLSSLEITSKQKVITTTLESYQRKLEFIDRFCLVNSDLLQPSHFSSESEIQKDGTLGWQGQSTLDCF